MAMTTTGGAPIATRAPTAMMTTKGGLHTTTRTNGGTPTGASGGAPLATVTHHAPTASTTAGQSTHQQKQHNRGHTTPMVVTAAAGCTTPPTALNSSDLMRYPMAVTQQGTPSSDTDGCDLTRHPTAEGGTVGMAGVGHHHSHCLNPFPVWLDFILFHLLLIYFVPASSVVK